MDLHPTSPLVTLFFGRTTHLVRHAACDVYTASRHILFPEDGRHPCEHGDLVDGWLASVPLRVVVATHSNVIMMRLQRRVAEGTLAAKDLVFVWVERSAEGTYGYKTTPITFNEGCEVSWWPKSVGREVEDEYVATLKALDARCLDRL